MKLTQVVEDSAARVNQLFARLLDTKHGATRIRDKLLAELDAELEVARRLDEEHLLPLLRANPRTSGLVAMAAADHANVRRLLGELKEMPKHGEPFLAKVTQLREAFQHSVRDERKELLPTIREALSGADAEHLAGNMAERRTDTAEAVQQQRGREEERRAETAATEAFGLASRLPQLAATALDDTGRALTDLTARTVESGRRASCNIARCGTPLEAAAVQARLAGEIAEAWVETGSRLLEISLRASQQAINLPGDKAPRSRT